MENINKLREELVNAKNNGFFQFTTRKGGEWLPVDKLLEEIDGLRVCSCPPIDNKS